MTFRSKEKEFIFDQNYKTSEMGGNWVADRRLEQIRLIDMQQVNKPATGKHHYEQCRQTEQQGPRADKFQLPGGTLTTLAQAAVVSKFNILCPLVVVLTTVQRITQREKYYSLINCIILLYKNSLGGLCLLNLTKMSLDSLPIL